MKRFFTCLLMFLVYVGAVGFFFTTKLSTDEVMSNEKHVSMVHNTNLNKIANSVTLLFKDERLVQPVQNEEDDTLNELPSIDPEVTPSEEEETEEKKEEIVTTPLHSVEASKYSSNPAMGFVVTEGNKTYSLDEYEFNVVVAVVAGEFDKNLDDALAVVSVILNRSDSKKWYNNGSPYKQVISPNQFEVYFKDYYLAYMPGGKNYGNSKYQIAKQAVLDGFDGIRNNNYLGFRAWWVNSYSDKYIVYGGNRYGYK